MTLRNRNGKKTRLKIGDIIAYNKESKMLVCFRDYREDPCDSVYRRIRIGEIYLGDLIIPSILISIINLLSAATGLGFKILEDFTNYDKPVSKYRAFRIVKPLR